MIGLAIGATGLVLATAQPARAASAFVEQLRRAESRDERDPERVEFASRAVRAWLPADGRPLLAHAHFLRAQGEAALFDDPAAEEDLSKALEIDPRNFAARLMRARARAALGRGAAAERDALDYLDPRPDDAEGWLVLGEARLAKNTPKSLREARAAYSRAASLLEKDDPRPALGEGRAWLAARRYREALAALSAAAESPKKRRAEILSWRSRAFSALGNWKAAREDLSVALPDLERALEERRRQHAVPRGRDAARRDLADAYFRRGLAGETLRLKDEALADHRQACGLGLAAACARASALDVPEPAPAPKPKKPRRRRNPKGDAGERIYAN